MHFVAVAEYVFDMCYNTTIIKLNWIKKNLYVWTQVFKSFNI